MGISSSSPLGSGGDQVKIFIVPPTDTTIAGMIPVPVASMIAGSACCTAVAPSIVTTVGRHFGLGDAGFQILLWFWDFFFFFNNGFGSFQFKFYLF